MKILHTADWHIGQFKGPVVDGVNLRSQDTVKCLEYMVQVAIEEKPDIVCVSGDIFHQEQVGPVRYSDEMITATNIITSLAHFSKYVIVMRGTPNHDGAAQFRVLERMLLNIRNVDVVTEPGVIKTPYTAREKEYAECIKRLGGVEKPAKCFAIVVEALERNPDQDFLGSDELKASLTDPSNPMYETVRSQLPPELAEAIDRAAAETTTDDVTLEGLKASVDGDVDIDKDAWTSKLNEALGDLGETQEVTADHVKIKVDQGDCLWEIGNALGIDWQTIAEQNGIESPYIIHPDQEVSNTTPYFDTDSSSQDSEKTEKETVPTNVVSDKSGVVVQVNLSPQFNISDTNDSDVIRLIKAHIKELADDLGSEIATMLSEAYENTPVTT